MIKRILLILLLVLLTIPITTAGNNTTIIDNATSNYMIGDKFTALESGDSNISFSNGYVGYYVEYGEHSAVEDDVFIASGLPATFEYNCLKVFFTFYYNETTKDVISTQHMIWKFIDNKEFSRFNNILYEKIVNTSLENPLKDTGKIKYNNIYYLCYSFKLFNARFNEYQNYIGYKIWFEPIKNETMV